MQASTQEQDDLEYRPFPNDTGRNSRQARLEVPLFVRALGIDTGLRILEIGCGRGIAPPVISRLCRPDRLVGVDLDRSLLDEAAGHTHGLDVELFCATQSTALAPGPLGRTQAAVG
jgi:protein-L-isoaspartate O-methyltransferase